MKHYELNIKNEEKTVHMQGVLQAGGADSALCGQDLIGDNTIGYGMAFETSKKVNCRDCIKLIKFCKKVSEYEY